MVEPSLILIASLRVAGEATGFAAVVDLAGEVYWAMAWPASLYRSLPTNVECRQGPPAIQT